MAPFPLEVINSGGMMMGELQQQHHHHQPGQISLSVLIDMIVQRTYHELTILAELLPRKTDMERKIEIFNFASRTRMLFIRLNALVKWASSASKVEKCSTIMHFLEKQSNTFLDTADQLARMARETLVRATLPNFHLPAAAEILTTGGYTRLPRCIKDRIIPPAPITQQEKRTTLLRLNQVIEQRLVSSAIPLQMRSLKVADGSVTFTVRHEFECRLALLGDGPTDPWTLLSLEMLVEDRETGQGKALMHSLQVGYVRGLIQSRLDSRETNRPLHDIYNVLHSLAQLLQLEVLHNQTMRLCLERLRDYIRVEEYIPGRALTISYWRELSARDPQHADQGYRLSIQVDPHDPAKPLIVIHTPQLTAKEADTAEKSIRTDHLSVESLLVHSIYVRTRARLTELQAEVQRRLGLGDVEATLHGSPAVLAIPILQPCLRSEQLLVSVDTHTGMFLAHVPQYPSNPFSPQIQSCLNGDRVQLEAQVSELRYWITARRIEKTLQQLPATPFEQLPLTYDLKSHPLSRMGRHKMYVRLHRQPYAILVVDYAEKPGKECEIQYSYHYLLTRPCSIEDDPKDETVVKEIPRVYMKALGMIEFNPFLVTHGTTTKVDVQELSEKLIGKRKPGGKVEAPIKRTKFPAYFISDLAHVVAFADERIPFTALEAQLTAKGILHSGIQVESNAVGLAVTIVRFPPCPRLEERHSLAFARRLLSAAIRRRGSFWILQWVVASCPLQEAAAAQQASTSLYSQFDMETVGESEKTVTAILGEWQAMVQLYSLVGRLHRFLQADSSAAIAVKFNYRSLQLEYGPGGVYSVSVVWKWPESRFSLTFGGSGPAASMNPHTLFRNQLEVLLNRDRDLGLLCKLLSETLAPALSLCRLPPTPHRGMSMLQRNAIHQTFALLPQTPSHVKILFYGKYCVDVHFRAEGLVSVRDGAYSMFDQTKVLEELQPIPGFKAFLSKYVDETAFARRTSQTEDDNPPSPYTMDSAGGDGSKSDAKFSGGHGHPVSPHSGASSFLQSPPSMNLQPGAAPSPAGSPFTSVASPLGGSPRSRPSPRYAGTSPKPSGGHGGSSHLLTQSRILPQRLWAAAIPTLLTSKAFDEICRPSSLAGSPGSWLVSPLHRFLGCVFIRRQLQHIIKSEEFLTMIATGEPSVIAFRVESLLCKVSINQENSFQSLHLKIVPDDPNQWQPDHLLTIQKFFDSKVAAPPYRPNSISGFCRLLHCPSETLKNIIQLMKFEVQPELVVQNNLKWNISLCLTIPPVAPNIFPVGQPGIIGNKEKILIFMHLTRANLPPGQQDPVSVVVPMVYNINLNQTSLASLQKELNNPALHAVQQHLNRWNSTSLPVPGRCAILPAILDLLMNLSLPSETSPGGGGGGGGFLMTGPGGMMGPGGQPPAM